MRPAKPRHHAGQSRLYPLHIVRTEPAPFGTADCQLIGVGDDDLAYILKRQEDGPLLPASEYLASLMAQRVGLAVPPFHIAQMPDRASLCFASREEGGTIQAYAEFMRLAKTGELVRYARQLARWYAFDLFTHNVDRHVNNFLFRQSILGAAMLGIDFSRALLTQGWPHCSPPPAADCNTRTEARKLHRKAPYPTAAAIEVLHRLAAIPDEWITQAISDLPEPWLADTLRRSVSRWWCVHRTKRVRLLRSHLANGRYL